MHWINKHLSQMTKRPISAIFLIFHLVHLIVDGHCWNEYINSIELIRNNCNYTTSYKAAVATAGVAFSIERNCTFDKSTICWKPNVCHVLNIPTVVKHALVLKNHSVPSAFRYFHYHHHYGVVVVGFAIIIGGAYKSLHLNASRSVITSQMSPHEHYIADL